MSTKLTTTSCFTKITSLSTNHYIMFHINSVLSCQLQFYIINNQKVTEWKMCIDWKNIPQSAWFYYKFLFAKQLFWRPLNRIQLPGDLSIKKQFYVKIHTNCTNKLLVLGRISQRVKTKSFYLILVVLITSLLTFAFKFIMFLVYKYSPVLFKIVI